MESKHRLIAILAGALLSLQTATKAAEAEPPADLNEAQRLVFMNDHLVDVASGNVITYDFRRRGKSVEAFSDTVKVNVTAVRDDGRRDLEFDFLTGQNHIDFHPAKAYRGNPVIIHFLERDILEMSKRTGGDIGYFRNRIRKSFANPEIGSAKVDVQGRQLDAVEVAVTPFSGDPNVDKFPLYARKRYDFLFAEAIPGGLYQIHTVVPDDSGADAMIDETMTFRDLSPAD